MQVTPWILDPTKCNLTSIRLPIGLCPAASPCGFSVPALVVNDLPALMTDDRCPLFRPDQSRTANRNSRQRRGGRVTARPLPGVPGLHFGGCGCVSGPALVLALPCSSHPLALTQRWSHSHRPARRVAQTQNGST